MPGVQGQQQAEWARSHNSVEEKRGSGTSRGRAEQRKGRARAEEEVAGTSYEGRSEERKANSGVVD